MINNSSNYQEKLFQIASKINLSEVDSKYEMLTKIIDQAFSSEVNSSGRKIIIFSIFRATIAYLFEKLRKNYPNYAIDTITGEDENGASIRDNKRIEFKDQEKPAILICSEVAGEGLDFQFCHYLVNYDLPWNPSRLEQRVGRLDRIGQQAEKITIINLVNKRTIEDHIMSKLFERVKIFSSAIGPLGELLSTYQKEFTSNVFKVERTEKEKIAYEQKVLENIERAQKKQAEFEKEQMDLVGVMDYFYNANNVKNVLFHEYEIKTIWSNYIEIYGQLTCKEIKIESFDEIYSIQVDDTVAEMLKDISWKGIREKAERKKHEYYISLIETKRQKGQKIYFTFNHKVALNKLNIEYLNISHPFIIGALSSLRSTYRPNKQIVSIEIETDILEPGRYYFMLCQYSVINRDTLKREHTEVRIYKYDVARKDGDWQHESDIIDMLLETSDVRNSPEPAVQCPEAAMGQINQTKSAIADDILRRHKKLQEYKMSAQQLSIQNDFQKRIQSEKKSMQIIHEPKFRKILKEKIELLEREMEDEMKKKKLAEYIVEVKSKGMLQVFNKGKTYDGH